MSNETIEGQNAALELACMTIVSYLGPEARGGIIEALGHARYTSDGITKHEHMRRPEFTAAHDDTLNRLIAAIGQDASAR